MRIGFSLLDLAMGGAQTFMVQLAQELASREHQISYFLYANRGDPAHVNPSLLASLDAVATKTSNPKELIGSDIIQLDGYHNLRRKFPYFLYLNHCVETYHSIYSIRRSGPIYAPYRVSISKAVQSLLRYPSDVIYNGIILPDFNPTLAQEGNKEFDVAILGRIHPVKGHILFLSICEMLFRQRGQLKALIIGGHPQPGTYQERVDAEIKRLRQLGVQIETTGDIPTGEVFDWLMRSRVLLVTSQSEGLGRMAVEALACCVPVVINPIGGLTEIVLDGKSGYWAEYDNPTSFAALANHLLGNDLLRFKFGQEGRLHVERFFSMDVVTDQYEALYQRVIGFRG